tara:strand:+ start:16937 stop:17287 length:351 start_codon:yes stop_codon:yes gene_type:complete
MKTALKILINSFIAFSIPAMAFAQYQKPNFLVIVTDQQNAKMMSCAGNTWLKTPNIDKLAEKGIRFENEYVTNPVCSLSKFSILTGTYPSVINTRHNASSINTKRLSQIIKILKNL